MKRLRCRSRRQGLEVGDVVRGDPTQRLGAVRTGFEKSEASFVEPYVRTLNDAAKRRHADLPGL
jgi:hypothetical protein